MSSVVTTQLAYLVNLPFLEEAVHRWVCLLPYKRGWKRCQALLGRPPLPPEELEYTTHSCHVKRVTRKMLPRKADLLFKVVVGDRYIFNRKS